MLDADIILATGESVSRWGFVGIRRPPCVGCGECPRARGICTGGVGPGGVWTRGAFAKSCTDCRSGDGSFGGGAIGNLKLDEKDPEGFRPVVGSIVVLGAVVAPGFLLGGRAGNVNSFDGSRMVGGKDAPPASGDGWVADRKPGEATAIL